MHSLSVDCGGSSGATGAFFVVVVGAFVVVVGAFVVVVGAFVVVVVGALVVVVVGTFVVVVGVVCGALVIPLDESYRRDKIQFFGESCFIYFALPISIPFEWPSLAETLLVHKH